MSFIPRVPLKIRTARLILQFRVKASLQYRVRAVLSIRATEALMLMRTDILSWAMSGASWGRCPIQIGTDQFSADTQGNLAVNGKNVNKIAIYNFNDYNNLKIAGEGMYASAGAAATLIQNPKIMWKTVEGSNVNAAEEMTDALKAQRDLQNCSQAIKMYDQVLSNAVTNIGKL